MKWFIWGIISIVLSLFWGWSLFADDQRGQYLIGATTDGHHQIELACDSCHQESFGGDTLIQEACTNCHGAELSVADDSHPKSKFTDPRNAGRVEVLDARYCVTCHIEHRREETHAMGVTLPDDFCFYCHEDIAEDRPTHKDLPFDSCLNAGCHNFHDNRALYEDFLVKHADQPANQADPHQPMRNLLEQITAVDGPATPLQMQDADGPLSAHGNTGVVTDWLETAHAIAGVNCTGCHQSVVTSKWLDKPDMTICKGCHEQEAATFVQGKHGMRLAGSGGIALSPMTPGMGRLPFKQEALDTPLTCTTCHSAHRFDTQEAAVESCLSCHDDDHSRNYPNSPHAALWEQEKQGLLPVGAGVSCATCHLPRLETNGLDGHAIQVMHNQNDNLRPNEKMIRSVCMDCHGFPFTLDALADPELIQSNFKGRPAMHVESIDWATGRLEDKDE